MPGIRPGWNGEKNKREMTNRNFPLEIPRFAFHRERFFFPWGFRCLPGCWYPCDPQLWDWGFPRGRAGSRIFFLNHGISSTLSPKGPFPWPVIKKGEFLLKLFPFTPAMQFWALGFPSLGWKNKPGNFLPYSSSSHLFVWLFFAVIFTSSLNFPPNLPARISSRENPSSVASCNLSSVFSSNEWKWWSVGNWLHLNRNQKASWVFNLGLEF